MNGNIHFNITGETPRPLTVKVRLYKSKSFAAYYSKHLKRTCRLPVPGTLEHVRDYDCSKTGRMLNLPPMKLEKDLRAFVYVLTEMRAGRECYQATGEVSEDCKEFVWYRDERASERVS
jgi:hypothetical protein